MTTTSIQSGTVFSYDGQTLKAQNSGSPWALTETGGGALQFQVTPGDQWSADPTTKNRTEVAVLGRSVADGTPIDVAYSFTVAPGAGSNAIIGQFHQDENTTGIAPPLAIGLVDDRMNVTVGYVGSSGVQTTQTIFTDTSPITRGSVYAMDIRVTFGTNGGGHVVVSRDGRTIAQYDGPLGWSRSESLYWKEGIYAQTADQNLTVSYDDLSIATGAPTALPTTPDHSRQYSTYDSGGTKLSTVQTDGAGTTKTTSFDAAGTVTKTVQLNLDGSQSIFDYDIAGQAYVSDHRLYDAAGTLIEIDTYDANGTRLEADTYAVTGRSYTAARQTYDGSGALATATYVNKDHSTTIDSYAAGTLTKATLIAADGTQTVHDYGIKGQGYVSDRRLYDASGTLTELDTYDASGTQLEADTYAVTGQNYTAARKTYDGSGALVAAVYVNEDHSTTTNSYAAGTLTKAAFMAADGTQTVHDYGIKGQGYVSDLRLYNAAGTLTELDTYDASGTRLEADTYAVTGQNYTAARKTYDGSGALVTSVYVNTDHSITTNSYAAGTLTKAAFMAADGTQTVYDYGIKGQGYVSDRRTYNAAGTLTELDTYDAKGTRLEADTYAVSGQSYTSARQTYDATGTLVVAVFINTNGSTTTDSYAAGVLTRALTRGVDGSQSIYDYGIKGQGYVSDRRTYNAAGTLTEFDTYNAAGIKLEADTYAVAGQSYTAARQSYDGAGSLVSAILSNRDGSTTTNSYTAGALTKALVRGADGTQTAYDYGIKGQGYVSDRRVYDAAGTLTELDTYDAAGTKLEADTYAVTGQSYTAARQTYGSGKLVSAVYINKDGSTTTDSYAAGILTKALTRGADGSQTIYDYGIKGQSYVSDRRLYDAAGTLTEFDAVGADGSMQVQAYAPRLTLAGGSGGDSFRSAGSDTFVFTDHFGHDGVSNFVAGSGAGHDVLRLVDPGGMNFLNLSIQQQGSDTVITVDPQDTITLSHVMAKTLTASNFSFH